MDISNIKSDVRRALQNLILLQGNIEAIKHVDARLVYNLFIGTQLCYPGQGICKNIRLDLYDEDHEIVLYFNNLFREWPKFSGDILFPISYDKTLRPRAEYYTSLKYNGPYGELRIELLNYLIERVRCDLDRRNEV